MGRLMVKRRLLPLLVPLRSEGHRGAERSLYRLLAQIAPWRALCHTE